jgi:LacI family transcriptional regulator, repressor for deo operon, udp, cdd, tsx, nupC, and nupG
MGAPHAVRGPAGILDVARRAGVSASTVSRSLRGSTKVSQRTRERVLRAAAELEYVPSPAASRLASGRTSAVGVIVPFATRWFFSEVLTGVEGPLREGGYDLLLYNVGDPAGRASFFGTMPLRRRVDAVLAVASSLEPAEQDALRALGVPLAVVGAPVPGFARVGVDDREGAGMAVRHLLLLGHRDVVMICGEPADPVGRATTAARREGFEAALAEAGLPVGPDRVVAEPWGVRGGMRATEQLLTRRTLPTAIFAESDEMALGALQVLRRAGLAVPGRVSLIGYDDHEMAPAGDLTTIAQPVRRQGELAARGLLAVLAGDGAGPAAADVLLPTRLVVRGTTGPPAG